MWGVLIALFLPAAIGLTIRYIVFPRNIVVFEMDWGYIAGNFLHVHGLYYRLFMTIFWISLVLSIIVGVLAQSEPSGILMLAAVYALLFNGWMVYCFEGYLHAKYPNSLPPTAQNPQVRIGYSNYTSGRYATTIALGLSSIILFVVGILSTTNALVNK